MQPVFLNDGAIKQPKRYRVVNPVFGRPKKGQPVCCMLADGSAVYLGGIRDIVRKVGDTVGNAVKSTVRTGTQLNNYVMGNPVVKGALNAVVGVVTGGLVNTAGDKFAATAARNFAAGKNLESSQGISGAGKAYVAALVKNVKSTDPKEIAAAATNAAARGDLGAKAQTAVQKGEAYINAKGEYIEIAKQGVNLINRNRNTSGSSDSSAFTDTPNFVDGSASGGGLPDNIIAYSDTTGKVRYMDRNTGKEVARPATGGFDDVKLDSPATGLNLNTNNLLLGAAGVAALYLFTRNS